MTAQVYLWPRPAAPGDQATIRLAGGSVGVENLDLIVREGGAVRSRQRVDVGAIDAALAGLPEELRGEAVAQWEGLRHLPVPLAGEVALDRPQVMGILNVTPDSFSDGGRFAAPEAQRAQAEAMLAQGAALIDIGGESTRPGADPVTADEELRRVVPAIDALAGLGATISVDTRRAAVMAAALAAGASVINDVSALRHDPQSARVVANAAAPVVLMHAPGEGENLHEDAGYGDVVIDVFEFLRARRDAAIAAGVARERIVLDPGIGFGKSLSDNLALMNALPLFHALGQPLLVGASRKRMIAMLSANEPPERRLGGSLALALRAMDAGVQLLRVHDVAETVQAARVWQALREAAD
jgi:dihydropteroate synthase